MSRVYFFPLSIIHVKLNAHVFAPNNNNLIKCKKSKSQYCIIDKIILKHTIDNVIKQF